MRDFKVPPTQPFQDRLISSSSGRNGSKEAGEKREKEYPTEILSADPGCQYLLIQSE